ncbi:MAG: LpqB family beta-propeller domain-containing protein [Singulisphaera sp.]
MALLMGTGEVPAGEEGGPAGPLVRHTSDGLDKQRPAWSPDGRQLAFSRHEAGGSHIRQYLMGANPPSAPLRVTKRDEPEHNAVFSPDGKTLLMVLISLSGTQGNLDIAALQADGSGQRLVARDSGKLSHQDWPAWSPDGSRFAFSSTHEGNQEIYTAAADGSQVTRVTQSLGIDAHPCWTPDGKRLFFASDRWGGLEIAGVLADGTGLTRLTQSPGLDDYPALSPDGSRITFVSNRDGQFEVYVCSADGSGPWNLSRHPLRDTYPTWRPDGGGVTFVSNRGGGSEIYTQSLDLESRSPAPRSGDDEADLAKDGREGDQR